MGLATLVSMPAVSSPDRADPLDSLMFSPPITPIHAESRVVRADQVQAICNSTAQQKRVAAWLKARRVTILSVDQTGLALHYYAQGIDTMTQADLLWEGLPRRADSLQALVDHAITRCHATGRPIRRLTIAGHAGLPGCAAFGGTNHDCVFKGRLSAYQRLQLVRLRPYLARDAEIELRQCTTGSGKEGQALLTALHQLTGAAASSYLSDFHFGDSAAYPRVLVDAKGYRVVGNR